MIICTHSNYLIKQEFSLQLDEEREYLFFDLKTGKLDELELCKSTLAGCLPSETWCLVQQLHVSRFLVQWISFSRTLGVNTQKSRALANPWAESPIPCMI